MILEVYPGGEDTAAILLFRLDLGFASSKESLFSPPLGDGLLEPMSVANALCLEFY